MRWFSDAHSSCVMQRPASPSVNVSGGWSRTVMLPNAGTLRVQVDARVRLLGGLESTEYGQAVLSVDGTRYGPVSNVRGVSLVETFGQDGVPEIPGAWQSLTVNIPSVTAGNHTITLGAFSNRPTDVNENCQVYFDNLTISVVGTPTQVAEEIQRRYGATADRVCLYFPGYPITDEVIGETVAAVKAVSGES